MVELPGDLVARVRAYNRRHRLFHAGQRVLVACSGGADSLAALALLGHPELELELVVGHVDHGLQPGSSDAAGAVARQAETLGLPCVAETLHLADSGERVSEEIAREARLLALERMAAEQGAEVIALGHTASDQLETLLQRLVRGAGLRGLSGMAPRRGRLVRPLLPLTGAETRRLVERLGWPVWQDPSNEGDDYLRNRLRHHVVPLLEAENPRIHEQAHRTTEGLREEHEALARVTSLAWERSVRRDADAWTLAVDDLAPLPAGLRARLLRRMWLKVRSGEDTGELTRQHLDYVAALLRQREGSQRIDLPGEVVALREYGHLRLCRRGALEDPGDRAVEIPGPGLYREPDLGWVLEAVSGEDSELLAEPGEAVGHSLALSEAQRPPDAHAASAEARSAASEARRHWGRGPAADSLGAGRGAGTAPLREHGNPSVWWDPGAPEGAWSLVLRNLRPGDRVQGSGGHRKVSDLMIDLKVPRHRRRRWPVLVAAGEIVWIPGLWKSASPAIREPEPGAPAAATTACLLRFRHEPTTS